MNFSQLPGYGRLWALGSGPSGSVFACRHNASGSRVALKFFHRDRWLDPSFASRFRSEAALWQELDNPGIVRFYECIETGPAAVAVMELVSGCSVYDLLAEKGQIGAVSALALADGILLALVAAHEIGLVHGNLKPQNVLLDTSNEIKLTDFGVLPLAGPETAGGCYRAPEERDGMPASPVSDIYAAAAILFRCVTGNEPSALTAKGAPILDQLPDSLRSLTLRALAQDPGERPQAAEFLGQLRDAAREAYGDSWRTEGSRVIGDLGSRQASTTARDTGHFQALAPLGGLHWPRISRGLRTSRRALAVALTTLAVAVGIGVFVIANLNPPATNVHRSVGGTNTVAPAAHSASHGSRAFAVFAGAWSAHGGGIDIQANGRFLMSLRTYQWCGQAPPPCDLISGNQIIGGDKAAGQLTSTSGDVATGTITQTTDQAATPKGQITITLNPSTNSLNIDNTSFCGPRAPVSYCGV